MVQSICFQLGTLLSPENLTANVSCNYIIACHQRTCFLITDENTRSLAHRYSVLAGVVSNEKARVLLTESLLLTYLRCRLRHSIAN